MYMATAPRRHSAGQLPLAVSAWQRLYQRAISSNVSTSVKLMNINLPFLGINKPYTEAQMLLHCRVRLTLPSVRRSLGDASVCSVACCCWWAVFSVTCLIIYLVLPVSIRTMNAKISQKSFQPSEGVMHGSFSSASDSSHHYHCTKAIFIQFTNCPVRWQCICISPMSSLLRDVIRRLPRMKLPREAWELSKGTSGHWDS